jgi:hypothetical protein
MMRVVFCGASACDASSQLYGRSGAKENKELLADESRGGQKAYAQSINPDLPSSTITAMFLARVFQFLPPCFTRSNPKIALNGRKR